MGRRQPAPGPEHITFADALRVAQTTSNVDPLSPSDDDEVAAAPPSTAAAGGGTER